MTVKCVVWDLDGTAWPDVAIEQVVLPDVDSRVIEAMDTLAGRGILNCVASRTSPALEASLKAHPQLHERIVVWEVSWRDKSAAVTAIAQRLGIGTRDIVLVDDSAFERAEVAARLPGTEGMTPGGLFERLDTAAFSPLVITAEAASRDDAYRSEMSRVRAWETSGLSHDAFRERSDIRLTLSWGEPGDADRIVELSERTHRFNASGIAYRRREVSRLLAEPSSRIAVGRLQDSYGDYGLIAIGVLDLSRADRWLLSGFAVSCRAAGRGVAEAVLSWLTREALFAKVESLDLLLLPTRRNLEMRVLLRSFGWTEASTGLDGHSRVDLIRLERRVTEPINVPPWLTLQTPDRYPASS